MNLSKAEKYRIRQSEVLVDAGFETSMGIYGEPFWRDIESGVYETETFDFIEKLYKSGFEYFIDVGAATGCMSLYAASTGLGVIAVEPQELVYSALRRNVNLNPEFASRISLEYALVSPSKDEISLARSFTPGAAGPIASGNLTKNSITLIELIEKCPVNTKIALKIDIEGAEFPLFADKYTVEYFTSRKPLVYVALHPGFKKPLSANASPVFRLAWRIQAAQDVVNFYRAISNSAEIQVASKKRKVNLVGLLLALVRDEKDYILIF